MSQFSVGSVWLVTERTAPAWAAVLELLDGREWVRRSDVEQAMREVASLADRTIANHLRSASARRWITVRDGWVRLRDSDAIRAHLAEVGR